jgi:purine nucleoside permease
MANKDAGKVNKISVAELKDRLASAFDRHSMSCAAVQESTRFRAGGGGANTDSNVHVGNLCFCQSAVGSLVAYCSYCSFRECIL